MTFQSKLIYAQRFRLWFVDLFTERPPPSEGGDIRYLWKWLFWPVWFALVLGMTLKYVPDGLIQWPTLLLPAKFAADHLPSIIFWCFIPLVVWLKTKNVMLSALAFEVGLGIHEGYRYLCNMIFNGGLPEISTYEAMVFYFALGGLFVFFDWRWTVKMFLWMGAFYLVWLVGGFPVILDFTHPYIPGAVPLWVHYVEMGSWTWLLAGAKICQKTWLKRYKF